MKGSGFAGASPGAAGTGEARGTSLVARVAARQSPGRAASEGKHPAGEMTPEVSSR